MFRLRARAAARPVAETATKRSRTRLGVVLAYVLLSLVFSYPAMLHPLQVSYRGQDSLLFLWNFWWVKFSLIDLRQSPFFCDYIFWPNGTSLALSSLALPYGLVSIPFQIVLGDMRGCLAATRFITFVSLVSSAWLCYELCRKVSASGVGAFVAGIVFAFVPYRMWSLHVLHVFCFEFIVLWVLALVVLMERPSLARGGALGVCSALLLYASQEFALYSLPLGGIVVLFALFGREQRPLRGLRLKALALALVLTALVALPLAADTIRVGPDDSVEEGFDRTVEDRSPSLVAMLLPSTASPLWRKPIVRLYDVLSPGVNMRDDVCLGWTAMALALAGLFVAPRRARLAWGVAAGLYFLLMLGPQLRLTGSWVTNVPLPYAVLRRAIPVFRHGRDTVRFLPILMLCLAVLSSFGVNGLMGAGRRRRRWIVAAACCALAIVEDVELPQPVGPFPVSEFYRRMADDKEDYAIMEFCQVEKARFYWQIVHKKRLVGLSRSPVPRASRDALAFVENPTLAAIVRHPLEFESLPPATRDEAIQTNLRLFRDARVRYVVIHRRNAQVASVDRYNSFLTKTDLPVVWSDSFERIMRLHGAVEAYRDADLVAYELPPPSSPHRERGSDQ